MDNKNKPQLNDLEAILSDRFGRYSKYIIQERALPDVRDGLKPVQRRILFAMYNDGNTQDKPYRKSAKTVGLVIGNYHPHGDLSVYEAMVRMSQDWKMNIKLVDMQGNNGSIDDDPAAAMRYTEARLSTFSALQLEDIGEDTVNFTPNFDDTSLEPSVLPSRVPQLLINGASGIAAGYATNIPPHNLKEVVEGTIYRLNHPECSLEELETLILGPDFPTGGIVQGKKGIHDAFVSGKGRIVVRAKSEINETRTLKQIILTEIPYEVVKSNLVKKLDDIRLNKQLDALLDVRDESDRNGLRIVLDVKKDADTNLILNYIFKNTDAQIYYNYNMVTIVNQRPVLCGLTQILDAFIAFRKEVVLRRSQFRHDALAKRIHILEGLIKAISVLDEVITIIRSSKDKADAKVNLISRFAFTETQSEAIVTLRLYRLTNTDIIEIKQELAELQHEMALLAGILKSPELLKNLLVKELQQVLKTFNLERRSKIEDEVSEIVIDKLSMIPNEKTVITLSRDGYVKRVSLRSYQSSEGVLPGLKEGDRLIGVKEAETYDTLMLFSDQGTYALIPVYSLEEAKWKDLGNHFGHYLKADGHEKIIAAMLVKTFNTDAFVVSVSRNGQIKKTPIRDFQVSRNSKVYDAMTLAKGDVIVATFALYRDQDVVILSEEGFGVRYTFESLPQTLTKSKGVKAMNLSPHDRIAAAAALDPAKSGLLLIAESGQMKRLKATEFNLSNRPAKGELTARKVKSNPQRLSEVKAVQPYDDICLTHDPKNWIQAKDIPFMDKTAGFNAGAEALEDWYLLKEIEEIRILDLPAEPEPVVAEEPVGMQETALTLDLSEEKAASVDAAGETEESSEAKTLPHDVEFMHFDL